MPLYIVQIIIDINILLWLTSNSIKQLKWRREEGVYSHLGIYKGAV